MKGMLSPGSTAASVLSNEVIGIGDPGSIGLVSGSPTSENESFAIS